MNKQIQSKKNSENLIDRRTFLKTSVASAAYFAASSIRPLSARQVRKQQPNILIFLTDQQHLNTISAAGCPYVKTPAMDYLVENGVHFTESYSSNPLCSPARSVIFTGRTTSETGVHVNGLSIRPDIPNMGQWFKENSNYDTYYAGKWHLPNNRIRSIKGFKVISTGLSGPGYLGDASISQACEALIRNRISSKPFLMVASFLQPHDICEWLRLNTYNPGHLRYPEIESELPPLPKNFQFDSKEPQYLKNLRAQREPAIGKWDELHWRYYLWSYYRHIEMVDAEIGRILQALQETGQIKNTVVFLISDHGEGMAGQQMVRKSNPYDGASKVPLVVSWPGNIQKGKKITDHLVFHPDIMPTVCDLAGIKPPPLVRGHSLVPLLKGKKVQWPNFLVTEMPGNRARLVRTLQFKYVTYVNDPVEMLFDRSIDPGETRNVSDESKYAEILKEHKKILMDWEKHLDPAPGVPNSDAWWRG